MFTNILAIQSLCQVLEGNIQSPALRALFV